MPDTQALDTEKLIAHFQTQGQERGDCVNGVRYFLLTEADRQVIPQLRQAYAVAFQELSQGKAQFWLMATEEEYDDEVLVALSCLGLTNTDQAAMQ